MKAGIILLFLSLILNCQPQSKYNLLIDELADKVYMKDFDTLKKKQEIFSTLAITYAKISNINKSLTVCEKIDNENYQTQLKSLCVNVYLKNANPDLSFKYIINNIEDPFLKISHLIKLSETAINARYDTVYALKCLSQAKEILINNSNQSNSLYGQYSFATTSQQLAFSFIKLNQITELESIMPLINNSVFRDQIFVELGRWHILNRNYNHALFVYDSIKSKSSRENLLYFITISKIENNSFKVMDSLENVMSNQYYYLFIKANYYSKLEYYADSLYKLAISADSLPDSSLYNFTVGNYEYFKFQTKIEILKLIKDTLSLRDMLLKLVPDNNSENNYKYYHIAEVLAENGFLEDAKNTIKFISKEKESQRIILSLIKHLLETNNYTNSEYFIPLITDLEIANTIKCELLTKHALKKQNVKADKILFEIMQTIISCSDDNTKIKMLCNLISSCYIGGVSLDDRMITDINNIIKSI